MSFMSAFIFVKMLLHCMHTVLSAAIFGKSALHSHTNNKGNFDKNKHRHDAHGDGLLKSAKVFS